MKVESMFVDKIVLSGYTTTELAAARDYIHRHRLDVMHEAFGAERFQISTERVIASTIVFEIKVG